MIFKKKPHILPHSIWKNYNLYLDSKKYCDGWDERCFYINGKPTITFVGFFKSEDPEKSDIIYIYTTHKAYKVVRDFYIKEFPNDEIQFIQKECNI